MLQQTKRTFLFTLLIMGTLANPAHAYLDPGNGSMVLQIILGGLAGFAVMLKYYWRRLVSLFKKSDS